ncbi:MAG TPA: hypothetical protein VFG85_08985 [Gaiellaceae bacterium]|jgi:hypothetical protein|nr:hypothetical protein [Gaiellaceae bacterium]
MAAPAPRKVDWEEPQIEDPPPLDPHAVQRRLRKERAKRKAAIDHKHEQRLASLRFLFLIGVLIFLTLFLSLSIWEKIGSLFGL